MRIYDLKLSCGCMVSLGSGSLLPCSYDKNPDCKYFEEYLCSPKWVERELQIYINNDCLQLDETVVDVKNRLQRIYDQRMKNLASLKKD